MAKDATPTPDENLLTKVKDDYTQYYDYIRPYRTKWDKYWKLWNNQRINKQYYGDTDSFEPMTFQMIESGTDNVYGSRPKFTYLPTRVEQETDTKILNGLLDYSWDKSNMDDKIIPWGREIKITGNGCLFPSWEDGCMKVIHIPIRDCILDTSTKDPAAMRFVGYRRLDMLDNLKKAKRYDPTANKGEGAWVPRYKNLNNIATFTNGVDDKLDKELKDSYAGSTLSGAGKGGQAEVIFMMYKDKFVEVANRSTIIAEFDNPYKLEAREVEVDLHNESGEKMFDESSIPQGAQDMAKEALVAQLRPVKTKITLPAIEPFLPFIMQRRYVDPALLIAKGDVEPFASTQEDLNDSLNIKKDNLAYNVQNVAVIDNGAKEAIPELAMAKPGSIIPIKGLSQSPNTFKWLEKPNMSEAADAEIIRAKQSIRDTARIDQTSQGVAATGNRTATEVNAQVAGASSGFNTETNNLEAGAYKSLGEMFLKMVQIFLTEEQLVRVVGKQGVEFKQFDPSKYWGEYDVKVQLESAAKAQQKMEADQAIEMMKLFQGDPDFNQVELKKLTLTKTFDMDADEIDLVMNPAQNNAVTAGGVPTGDGTMATGVDPNNPQGAPLPPDPALMPSPTAVTNPATGQVHESADLVKLYALTTDRPHVQEQIISILGFDPGTEPPVSLVKTAQELAQAQDTHAMKIQAHQTSQAQAAQALAAPPEVKAPKTAKPVSV
jgi:hypothetical protein